MGQDKLPAPPPPSVNLVNDTRSIDVELLQLNLPSGIGTMLVFVFKPTILTLTNPGGVNGTSYQVTFNLTSNIPGAVFVEELTQSGTPPSGITPSLTQDNTHLTLAFNNVGIPGPEDLQLKYKIKVRANGNDITSDDPEIDIPPPT